jgi:hypothetical protein
MTVKLTALSLTPAQAVSAKTASCFGISARIIDKNWQTSAICAGTYDVKITRAEDAAYQSYENTFTNVMTITKNRRSINAVPTGSSYKAIYS